MALRRTTAALLLCTAGFHARADQIVLKNGDKATGKIVTSDDKTVTIKTEFMGEVKVDRSAIVSISSDEALHVTLKGGEKAVGTIVTEQKTVRVRQADNTVLTTSLDAVEAVRNDAMQKAWEREKVRLEHPPLTDFWTGNIDLSLATARGNARTSTLGAGASARRTTGKDKIGLTFAQIYSTQSTTEPFGATANRVSGGARYDRDVNSKAFAFGFSDFDFDEFQSLDLRSVLGGGLGYHILKRDGHTWDFGAGGAWNRENFSDGLVRNSGELVLNEESGHQLTAILRVFQRASFYPNLNETGEYRLNFDGGASIKLTRFLAWNITLTDRFLSNPIAGKKSNDILLTTGIGLTFEQK